MSNIICVSALKVEVIEGQGIGEGDFEIRLNVSEGNHSMTWPSFDGSEKVDNGGAPKSIENGQVAYYTVNSGTLSKMFTINVTEVDSGFNADDTGLGYITFSLTPNMAATTKYADIKLNRKNASEKGKVRVTLQAEVM
jgi:hypothetical protein